MTDVKLQKINLDSCLSKEEAEIHNLIFNNGSCNFVSTLVSSL